jgi:hypothetical protein
MVSDPANGSRILLSTNRIWSSTDAGVTWKAITAASQRGWNSAEPVTALTLAPSDSKTTYAAAGGHIFHTTDVTAANPTWTARDLPDLQSISAIVVNPKDATAVCVARDKYVAARVYCSTTGGQNWNNATGDLPDGPVLALTADYRTSPATLYVGTLAGVYASVDGGAHWAVFGAGLPNTAVAILVLQNNLLSAATHGRGAWQILVN